MIIATPNAGGFPGDGMQQAESLEFQKFLSVFNADAQHRRLCTGLGKPLRFVPQETLPADMAYEAFIAQTGGIPTRDNLHDRYNALVWLAAPLTKALLNRLQHQEIIRLGGVTRRGSVRDALTIWDENLLVLVADESTDQSADLLKELLERRDWSGLFLKHRSKWHRQWHARLFGHALMEKLRKPFKAITAHVVIIQSYETSWPALDQALVDWLSAQKELSPRLLRPLPVMGIPGWCSENADPMFYFDLSVFRK